MPDPENITESSPDEERMDPAPSGAETEKDPPEAGKQLPKTDLIKKISALYARHQGNRSWVRLICDELNAEEIPTVRGKQWTGQTLRIFIKENGISLAPPSGKQPAAEKTFKGTKKKTEKPQKPAQGKTTGGRKKKQEPEEKPTPEPQKTLLLDDNRPAFRKDIKRKGESIRLSVELVNRAKAKQMGDVPRSGDSLPKLIELLLWHYLDRPEQFLWNHKGEKW